MKNVCRKIGIKINSKIYSPGDSIICQGCADPGIYMFIHNRIWEPLRQQIDVVNQLFDL